MTPDQILQRKLNELRPRFLAVLADRLDRLKRRREEIEGAPDPTNALRQILADAHQTAGTAASFGFKALGTVCSRSEEAIGSHLSGKSPRPSLEDITATIDDLMSEMTFAISGHLH